MWRRKKTLVIVFKCIVSLTVKKKHFFVFLKYISKPVLSHFYMSKEVVLLPEYYPTQVSVQKVNSLPPLETPAWWRQAGSGGKTLRRP